MPKNPLAAFVDRREELGLFKRMLRGETERRILLLFAPGEQGKTTLLLKMEQECRAYDPKIPIIRLDFEQSRSGMTPAPAGVGRAMCGCLGNERTPALCACLEPQRQPSAVVDANERGTLHKFLVARYSDGELNTICYQLGIEYASLPGTGKSDKARELLLHLERKLRLGELVALVQQDDAGQLGTVSPSTLSRESSPTPTDEELGRAMLADLAALGSRLVILVDTFEKANPATCAWLEHWLLNALLDRLPQALVVLAGRPECESFFADTPRWGLLTESRYTLPGLQDPDILEHWRRLGLQIAETEVSLLGIARSSPGKMAQVSDLLLQTRGGQR